MILSYLLDNILAIVCGLPKEKVSGHTKIQLYGSTAFSVMIMMVMIKSDQTYHLKHCLGFLGPAETDFLVVSMVACLQAQRLAFQLAQWQNHNHDYIYDYKAHLVRLWLW